MIVSETFLKQLKSVFDLNIYEVKVWTALLSRGVAPAGELADLSGVPRSRSYDVLESLEKKGFIIMKLGKPIKYLAVKPEEILMRLKGNVETQANEQVKVLEKVKNTDTFQELALLYNQGIEKVDPTDMSGILKGRKNVMDHLKAMINNAEKSVTIVTTADGLLRKTEGLKSAIKKANERGVVIRMAAPTDNLSDLPKDVLNVVEFRKMEGQKARFVLADGKNVTFMLSDDKDVHETYDLGVWVNTPFFANALEQMFELSWNSLKVVH